MARDLSELRESYQADGLRRADLAGDPLTQFERWWDAWVATDPYDAAACTLSTATADGAPSSRIVLCRGFDADGLVIYTNQEGRKSRDLASNPRAALVFGWIELSRQVRIEGPVSIIDDETADAYWATRPRGSQIGAWASDQSEVVADRAELDRHQADAEAQFGAEAVIPRPPYWGGYRVAWERVEFWQGQPNRLHDRFRYERSPHADTWTIDRLSP